MLQKQSRILQQCFHPRVNIPILSCSQVREDYKHALTRNNWKKSLAYFGMPRVDTTPHCSLRIFFLLGAGISCNAGIPDFRTPGSGLYDNLQKYNLPHPTAVFDLEFYKCNPRPFVQLASELWPGMKHSPTVTHSFIALLERKGMLLRNYTQVGRSILYTLQHFLHQFLANHNDLVCVFHRTLTCSMYWQESPKIK